MLRPCASERLAAGTSAVMTAAPLRIDRRDTSVGRTRAVVSSQQLMNGSPEANLSLRQQSSTQPKGLSAWGVHREFRSNQFPWRSQIILLVTSQAEDCPSPIFARACSTQ